MRLSDAPWLHQEGAQKICAALEAHGFRALFVGGCVRNALMGLAVQDLDLASDALPQTTEQIMLEAGLRTLPTGIAHGTLTVIAHGCAHEITTFRRDVESDGRHARVAFSARLEEDALRRDFTMNALYADRRGEVIDPLGGLEDLRARKVRFIADPGARIREDYLRILRFFRFHACYGDAKGGIDAEGLAACAAHAEGLARLSRERIGSEMLKLLSAPDPAPAVASMAQAGVLARVLPGAAPEGLAPFVHLSALLALPPDPLHRLAALTAAHLAQEAGALSDLTKALRLSRAASKRIGALSAALASGAKAGELGYVLGAHDGAAALALQLGTQGAEQAREALQALTQGAKARFPLRASDLAPLGGPALGAALRKLERAWIDSAFTLTRQELIALGPPPG